MSEITSVPLLIGAIALFLLVAVLHILTALLSGKRWARAVGYVNIFLHAPLLVTLVLAGADFQWGVLAVCASAFLYTLLRYIPYRQALGKGAENDTVSEAVAVERDRLPVSDGVTEEGGV